MKKITLILLFGCLISNIYTRDSCEDLGKDAKGNSIKTEKQKFTLLNVLKLILII